jgi:hypothetical protein
LAEDHVIVTVPIVSVNFVKKIVLHCHHQPRLEEDIQEGREDSKEHQIPTYGSHIPAVISGTYGLLMGG